MDKLRQQMKKKSLMLIILWVVVSVWGIANIYSTTFAQAIALNLVPKSVIVTLIAAFGLLLVCSFCYKNSILIYKIVRNNSTQLFLISILVLIVTFFVGGIRGGARSVIDLGIVDFQPLELVKISVIIFLAGAIWRNKITLFNRKISRFNQWKSFVTLFAIALIPSVLILIQPDLGGAIIYVLTIYLIALSLGINTKRIMRYSLIGLVIVVMVVLIQYISPKIIQGYQLSRISAWLDPFSDTTNTGWGITNSLVGISNGDLIGEGFLKGVQKSYLQTGASTDYIFVTICEEWGVIGAIITIGLLLAIVYHCFEIGNYATDRFGLIYCYGFGYLILVQMAVNICGVLNLIPMTGVTLPFISYGINSYAFLSLGLFFCIVIERRSSARLKKDQKVELEGEYGKDN